MSNDPLGQANAVRQAAWRDRYEATNIGRREHNVSIDVGHSPGVVKKAVATNTLADERRES